MMYPTAGAGTIILICVLLLACGFAAGFIIAKAFASLKPRKRMVRGIRYAGADGVPQGCAA